MDSNILHLNIISQYWIDLTLHYIYQLEISMSIKKGKFLDSTNDQNRKTLGKKRKEAKTTILS